VSGINCILIVLFIDDRQDDAGLLAGRERMTFNLSDFIWEEKLHTKHLNIDYVKEFIRLLKERFEHDDKVIGCDVWYEINKLTGDELI